MSTQNPTPVTVEIFIASADGKYRVWDVATPRAKVGDPRGRVVPLGDRRAEARVFADERGTEYEFAFWPDSDRRITAEALNQQFAKAQPRRLKFSGPSASRGKKAAR